MVIERRLALAAALLCACTTPRTEILLVTDTDLAVPSELDQMRVQVTSPGGEVQSSEASFGPGELPPPRVLGLVNDTGRLGPYSFTVQGLRAGGVIVERRGEFYFQAQRTLVLRVRLTRDCLGVSCSATETCAAGACRDVEIQPEELEEWDGQVPIPMLDASVPPPEDGGGTDAGRDAGGGGDAGCMPEVCNDRDDDCDGSVDEGLIETDPSNCGSCGNVCTVAHGTAGCEGGACTVASCDAGWDDCDGDADNGCEADLTRPQTCGSCDTNCRPPDRNCCDGSCC